MDFNATLIFQSIAFALFAWFVMAKVWPPVSKAMRDRQARIADGLAAAEKGSKALEDAAQKRDEELKAARTQAQEILGNANRQATQIVEHAKSQAKTEAERILASAQAEGERELARARDELRKQVGELAVLGAAKVLKREIDAKRHQEVLQELAAKI